MTLEKRGWRRLWCGHYIVTLAIISVLWVGQPPAVFSGAGKKGLERRGWREGWVERRGWRGEGDGGGMGWREGDGGESGVEKRKGWRESGSCSFWAKPFISRGSCIGEVLVGDMK